MKIQTKMLKRLISILCAATMVASGAVVSVGAVDPVEKGKKSKSASVEAGKGQDRVKPGYVAQHQKKLDFNKKSKKNKKNKKIDLADIEKEKEAKLKNIYAEVRKTIKDLNVKIARNPRENSAIRDLNVEKAIEERKNKIDEKANAETVKANAAKTKRYTMEQKEAERNVQKAKDFSKKYEKLKEDFNKKFEELDKTIRRAYAWNAKRRLSAIHSILTKHNNLVKQCNELKNEIKKNDACKQFMSKTRRDNIYMLDKPLTERIRKTNEQLKKAIDKLTDDFYYVVDKYYDDVLDKYCEKQIKELDKKKLINKEANKDKIVIKNNKVDNTNKSGNTYKEIYGNKQNKQKLIKINNKAKNTKKTNLNNKKKIALSSKYQKSMIICNKGWNNSLTTSTN